MGFSSLLLQHLPIAPEIFMVLCVLYLIVVGVFIGNSGTSLISNFALVCYFLTGLFIFNVDWGGEALFDGMYIMDGFAGFAKLAIVCGLAAATAMSTEYLKKERIYRFEYPIMIMLAGIGMMLMISAGNLLVLYMGIELQSISLYVLAAFHRDMSRSAEAGVKYFVLGAMSSGILLFGISLIYGMTGAIGYSDIAYVVSSGEGMTPGLVTGLVFVICALAFKISAVPFHMWVPDVYHGAPTSSTALFAVVTKIAAFAMLVRFLFDPFHGAFDQWGQVIWLLSVLSMVVGAFAALKQTNIKRLMAYSAISHIGYALMGVAVGTLDSLGACMFYLFIYMIMAAGSFAVILVMRRDDFMLEDIADFSGLARERPFTAYSMVIMMFSMSGIPPLAGFFAKLAVFQAAVNQGYYVLAVTGVLTSVVAAFYYLRVIKTILFDEPVDSIDAGMPFPCRAVMLASSVFIVLFAPVSGFLFSLTSGAAQCLFPG